jgi:phage N-6-adenine-methyltransferase
VFQQSLKDQGSIKPTTDSRAYTLPSQTVEWATPQALFDRLNAYHNFDLDAAASSTNHKVDKWFGLDHPDPERRNGLEADWDGERVWLNPPYGRILSEWVAKSAYHVHRNGGEVVLLLPARTDTRWFHDHCVHHAVEFIKGRLKFGDAKTAAPFPSMLVRMK